MRYQLFLGFCFVVLLLACCVSRQPAYEFPVEMSQAVRTEFGKQCDKGQILYEINCSGCHSVNVKRKKMIPDFKPEQLKGYELRVANAKHEAAIKEESVTAEELGLIMTFLSYKIKTGIPVNPRP